MDNENNLDDSKDWDEWDPMSADYCNGSFNGYNRQAHFNRFEDTMAMCLDGKGSRTGIRPSTSEVLLHVSYIPHQLGSLGVKNLFLKAGNVLRMKMLEPRNPPPGGELLLSCKIVYATLEEAEKSIRMLDKRPPFHLRVALDKTQPSRNIEKLCYGDNRGRGWVEPSCEDRDGVASGGSYYNYRGRGAGDRCDGRFQRDRSIGSALNDGRGNGDRQGGQRDLSSGTSSVLDPSSTRTVSFLPAGSSLRKPAYYSGDKDSGIPVALGRTLDHVFGHQRSCSAESIPKMRSCDHSAESTRAKHLQASLYAPITAIGDTYELPSGASTNHQQMSQRTSRGASLRLPHSHAGVLAGLSTAADQVGHSRSSLPSDFAKMMLGDSNEFASPAVAPPVIPSDNAIKVTLTHLESISNFYLTVDSNMLEFNAVCHRPLNTPGYAAPPKAVAIGELFSCIYSLDSVRYRAEVLETNVDGTLLVMFIDYGNTEVVSIKDLLPITDELKLYPRQAIACGLHANVPGTFRWTEDDQQLFKNRAESKKLHARTISRSPNGISLVELTNAQENGTNLAHTLLKRRPDQPAIPIDNASVRQSCMDLWSLKQVVPLTITDKENPDSVWAMEQDQNASYLEELKMLFNDLAFCCEELLLTNPGPVGIGTLVGAKSPSDHTWYRGVVTAVNVSAVISYSVRYLDCGSLEEVTTLVPLPQQFTRLRSLAIMLVFAETQGVREITGQVTATVGRSCPDSMEVEVRRTPSSAGVAAVAISIWAFLKRQQLLDTSKGRKPGIQSVTATVSSAHSPDQLASTTNLSEGPVATSLPSERPPSASTSFEQPNVPSTSPERLSATFAAFERPMSAGSSCESQISLSTSTKLPASTLKSFEGSAPAHTSSDRSVSSSASSGRQVFSSSPTERPASTSTLSEPLASPALSFKLPVSTRRSSGDSMASTCVGATKMPPLVPLSKRTTVAIIALESLTSLHVQVLKDSTAQVFSQLANLSAMIAEYPGRKLAGGVVPGQLVCAPYPKDSAESKMWYRAVVLTVEPSSDVWIRFIDYGNKEKTTLDQLQRVPQSFCDLPTIWREVVLQVKNPLVGLGKVQKVLNSYYQWMMILVDDDDGGKPPLVTLEDDQQRSLDQLLEQSCAYDTDSVAIETLALSPPLSITSNDVVSEQAVASPGITVAPAPTTATQPPVIATPPPVISTPPPVISAPPPVISAPPPVISAPPPVIATPPPVIATPPPVIATPPPVIATPPPVIATPPPTTAAPPPGTVPCPAELLSGRHDIFILYVKSPSEFYLCNFLDVELMHRLNLTINGHCLSEPEPTCVYNPKVNDYCVAMCQADMSWYRGRVFYVGRGKVHVYFIDFGSTEILDTNFVRRLIPALAITPALALRCSLEGYTDFPEWPEDLLAHFQQNVVEMQYASIEVISKTSQGRYNIRFPHLEEDFKSIGILQV